MEKKFKLIIPCHTLLANSTINSPDIIYIRLGTKYNHQLLPVGQNKQLSSATNYIPVLDRIRKGIWPTECGVLSEDDKIILIFVIKLFLKLEEIECTQQLSPCNAKCKAHFEQHTTSNKDGRFARLPFCTEPSALEKPFNIQTLTYIRNIQ